jgi:hypothetical protein
VAAVFDPGSVEAVLDLFETMEIAWHDLYGEITPPESVVDDALVVSGGNLAALIKAVRLGLADWRDLRVAAGRTET